MDAPRENLVRAFRGPVRWTPAPEARNDNAANGDGTGDGRTMYGFFTPFGTWSEIHSYFEGDFLERTVKGAFAKTIKENRANVRALFDHGFDPTIGDKPLGPVLELREEDFGPYYEVELLRTSYNTDIIEMLRADPPVLGASYRFSIIQEVWVDHPKRSAHNPEGLPERTIKEVRLMEFGPTAFPAFPDATAKVRSLTDHYLERSARSDRTPDEAGRHPEGPAPDETGAASTTDGPPPAPEGLTYAQREHALRALTI